MLHLLHGGEHVLFNNWVQCITFSSVLIPATSSDVAAVAGDVMHSFPRVPSFCPQTEDQTLILRMHSFVLHVIFRLGQATSCSLVINTI